MQKSSHKLGVRRAFIEVTEKNFYKSEEARAIIGEYKGRHRLPTMVDALLEMLKIAQEKIKSDKQL